MVLASPHGGHSERAWFSGSCNAVKIIVAGATGFIGRAIVAALLERGDYVVALSRNTRKAQQTLRPSVEILEWSPPAPGSWMEAFNGADGVVNVSGEQVVSP